MPKTRVIQLDPADRRRVQQFLDLPFRIYRDIPQWVPPLAPDARRMLDRRRHPFYNHSQAAFFLALDDRERPVGRLAALDNRRYNRFNRAATAFFYLFECQDDRDAARALFDAAFAWARGRDLSRMIGPKGFLALDGSGLLIRGFQHQPAFGLPYNPSYYPALIEAVGFEPERESVSGYLDARKPIPDKIHHVARRVQERRGLHVARFKTRRELRAVVPELQMLYDAALGDVPGGVPLTEDEIRAMANQLIWFADPRLVKIVRKGHKPVGFLLAYPDISAAVQRTRGRIFPFGWIDLLLEFRRTTWINVNGAGIVEEHRGMGGTALLFSEMHKSVIEGGFHHADLVQVGVENDEMQRELRRFGVDFYKAHRLYHRAL